MEDELKVVIPAAGTGTRLFPHTFTKPKSMIYLAGKPIIGHILDRMIDLAPAEVVLVVGYRKEQLVSYVEENYGDRFDLTFVEQEELLGLGHSILTAREVVEGSPVMIALGDMIFRAGYLDFYRQHLSSGGDGGFAGSIGVKEVDDPRKYGMVELEDGCIRRLEEKPEHSESRLGIAGVYFIRETPALFEVLEEMVRSGRRSRGEFQLTDALQIMVERGFRFRVFQVSSWYDCGRTETLLASNRVLLDELNSQGNLKNRNYTLEDSVIVPPVAIGEGSEIHNSVIGPYTSIASSTIISKSIISDSIIGERSSLSNVNLRSSVIGDGVNVRGKHDSLNIGDASSIEL